VQEPTTGTAAITLKGLGLRPVINAAATLTKLGGSVMPPEVVAAMNEGALTFVDLPALQLAIGKQIAELTRNEAAYVSSGAAAGIVASVAAALAGSDPDRVANFPSLDGFDKTEVIVHRSQRNGYDYAARQTGARFVEIGDSLDELRAALSPRTGAVLWFAGRLAATSPELADVIASAHEHGVPVIVDAAAQIPRTSNLWHFTRELGADIAIFSGGKGLRGPQSSGLVLGRADLVAAMAVNGSPNSSIGRPMKVGKEELFGVLAALKWTLAQDEERVLERYEQIVSTWISGLSELPGVTVERGFPSEAGQPYPRAIVTLGNEARMNAEELTDALWDQDPRIAISRQGDNAIALNPQTIADGEEIIVTEAIQRLL
jgi:L-seryl-tRNA(Ser) seleniumtransferase